ncbi:phage baseplate assembly protein V [uncultured Desulfovibrio sp.]|uniref:phage baseplate assembly protein V n=1 Tax=uncultured Desulfovibrio sp. TaxID=167968 RepID=UPI00272C6657|nr:phage baseplate assembly protein V [uncultured Desulfovibrio sp.]
MELEQVQDLLAQCIRVGTVTGRQPETLRVQVRCADTVTDALVTDWLPVLVSRASGDCQYDLPDVGDAVLCLFLPHGREAGFVLGCLYSGNTPPVTDGDKWHRVFRDGTTLEYDRKAHKLTANVKGDVDVTATGSVTGRITGALTAEAEGAVSVSSAARIALNAPAMNLGGNGGSTQAAMQGTFRLQDGDIIVEGISFLRHVHSCPHGGTTGAPQ